MKRYIQSTYINEDDGASRLNYCTVELQSIRDTLEELIEYNEVYQNDISHILLRDLRTAYSHVDKAIGNCFSVANTMLDHGMIE